MAKKTFTKTGGFGTKMYQGKQQSEAKQDTPKRKQKVSEKGFIRHTLLIRPDHLAELREVAKLAKADMQEVLAAALDKYFLDNWPDDKKENLRALREKEAKEIQEEKDNLLL